MTNASSSASYAVALTFLAVILAALSPLFAPLSGYTLAMGLFVVLAGLSLARAARQPLTNERKQP